MSQPNQTPSSLRTHHGSCHCGAVRYEAQLDLSKGFTRCNCSICLKLASASITLKPAAFRLLQGREALGTYKATPQSAAHRLFCTRGGVYVYGEGDIPEVGGAFVSVNANTLDGVELAGLPVGYWDGRHDNWGAGLRPEPWPVLVDTRAA